MPILVPGQPMTVATPELLVENRLTPGLHRFQLVVTDEAGLESTPFELAVTVRRPIIPRPRPDIIDRPDILDRIERVDRPIPIRPPRRPQ
jgi:hypothetical protein